MPIQRVEHWEEKARNADEMAKEMSGDAKIVMQGIAQLYRHLAKEAAKLAASEKRKN